MCCVLSECCYPVMRRAAWALAVLGSTALRTPPRRIAAEKTLRVLIADVGDEVQWLPGDRRTVKRPSPSQAAALNAAAAESLFSASPALVAMLPTVAQQEYPKNEIILALGGGGRRPVYTDGVHDEGTRRDQQSAFRRAFMDAKQTSSGLRVAALCAVRGVRTAGSRDAKGVRPVIERATLEVVGRVAVKRLEVLTEKEEAYWSDDRAAGGTGLVAAVGGSAYLQDAWVDEIKQSPVHAVHRLRPLADDCSRFHDLIRARLRDTTDEVDLAVDRSLKDAAAAALAATSETEVGDAVGATLYDAYGDVLDTPEEINELRALSFAAWRALRPPRGCASANDVMWAFGTRSTEARLQRARELLLAQWEALDEASST